MSQSLIAQFIELALSRGVLRFGEFELKSGRISPYFYNAVLFCVSEESSVLGSLYASKRGPSESTASAGNSCPPVSAAMINIRRGLGPALVLLAA